MAKRSKTAKKKKRPKAGQPSKYNPKYCQAVITYMRNGGSFKGFCGKIGIANKTGMRWTDAHKEFKEAREIGQAGHMYWCDRMIKSGIWGGKAFNPVMLIFSLKNIHGWRDRVEIADMEEEEAVFSYEK